MTAPRHPANQLLLPGVGDSNNVMVGILFIGLGRGAAGACLEHSQVRPAQGLSTRRATYS